MTSAPVATAASNFGSPIPGTQYNPNLLSGWGVRPYNYEWTASVQREIVPRVSVDVGYFRRVFGNFQVTDNLILHPSDFDTFSMVMPPAGSGLPAFANAGQPNGLSAQPAAMSPRTPYPFRFNACGKKKRSTPVEAFPRSQGRQRR